MVQNGKKVEEFSAKQKVEYAVFQDKSLNRETIKEWLKKDIYGTYLLLSEVLASQECLEALTTVFYARYEAFQKEKAIAREIPLK